MTAYYPACFDSARQYSLWISAARISPEGIDGATYCTDCTQEHKDEMVEAGRCMFPWVVFHRGERNKGELKGYRSQYQPQRRYKTSRKKVTA